MKNDWKIDMEADLPKVVEKQVKTLLTDCDGVLLNWLGSFRKWMFAQDYDLDPENKTAFCQGAAFGITPEEGHEKVVEFCNSDQILNLEPLNDAVEWVKKLHNEGWTIHVITSISNDKAIQEYRRRNLQQVFGSNVFSQLFCLGTCEPKNSIFEKFSDKNYFYVEDQLRYCHSANEFGLRPLVYKHKYNRQYEYNTYPEFANWEQIYQYIS